MIKRDIIFQLVDVLKVNVLKNAPAFSELDTDVIHYYIDKAFQYAESILVPLNQSADECGIRLVKSKTVSPAGFKDAWQKLMKEKIVYTNIPDESDKIRLPESIDMAINEILFAANSAFQIYVATSASAIMTVWKYRTDNIQKLYLEKMISGTWNGSMCFTEHESGSDIGNIKTTAQIEDDKYLIKGEKKWIIGGDCDLTENSIYVV